MRVLCSLFLITILSVPGAWAQGAPVPAPAAKPVTAYCDTVESTADLLECVNRHHEEAMDRLNTVFENLAHPAVLEAGGDSATEDKTGAQKIHNAQKAWITYRDAECDWEKSQAENPSDERIDELSCLATLTEARTERLALIQGRKNDSEQRKYGTWPRWMNLLSREYPDTFWRHNSFMRVDLDCDGDEEYLLTGVRVSPAEELEVQVAVVEVPAVGLPEAKMLSIPLISRENTDEQNPSFCKASVGMKSFERPAPDKSCAQAIRLQDNLCSPILLYHEAGEYVLSKENPAVQ